MKIKICGLTDAQAVDAACSAGADFIGFVFAGWSSRYVAPSLASELAARAPAGVDTVAVLREVTVPVRDEILAGFAPAWLQADAGSVLALPPSATAKRAPQALPVYRDGEVVPDATSGLILYEAAQSGAGMRADWAAAAALAKRARVMLAGGLDPHNVADAIVRVRPWAVDVSSGVESAPGVKCPHKIRAFVAAAREAAAGAAC